MTKVHQLQVELLTAEAFQPFGTLIGPRSHGPDFRGLSGTQLWALDFQSDGRLQVGYIRVPYQPLTCTTMEQHYNVTQGFIPMGSPPAVVAVAPPTERGALPRPDEVRAFLLDGTQGYILHRNTWHSLDRFPLSPPHGDWVILTDWETTQDLQTSAGLLGAERTRTVDFEQQYGVVFAFRL